MIEERPVALLRLLGFVARLLQLDGPLFDSLLELFGPRTELEDHVLDGDQQRTDLEREPHLGVGRQRGEVPATHRRGHRGQTDDRPRQHRGEE